MTPRVCSCPPSLLFPFLSLWCRPFRFAVVWAAPAPWLFVRSVGPALAALLWLPLLRFPYLSFVRFGSVRRSLWSALCWAAPHCAPVLHRSCLAFGAPLGLGCASFLAWWPLVGRGRWLPAGRRLLYSCLSLRLVALDFCRRHLVVYSLLPVAWASARSAGMRPCIDRSPGSHATTALLWLGRLHSMASGRPVCFPSPPCRVVAAFLPGVRRINVPSTVIF